MKIFLKNSDGFMFPVPSCFVEPGNIRYQFPSQNWFVKKCKNIFSPKMFQISDRVFRSLITWFNLCETQCKNKVLIYFLRRVPCTPPSFPNIIEQPSNPKLTHFSGLVYSFTKSSSMVCAIDWHPDLLAQQIRQPLDIEISQSNR